MDDYVVNRRVLHELLQSWRIRDTSASSGPEALWLLGEAFSDGDPYQLAFLDQNMPEMKGTDLAREIKSDPNLREMGLILLSSSSEMNECADAVALLDVSLMKPLGPSALFDALTSVWTARQNRAKNGFAPREREKRLGSRDVKRPQFNARVLVVDDSSTNQKVARLILESLGCRVDLASNGAEAIQMVQLLPYDIVFMDCEMPEIDGFDATRKIRELERAVAKSEPGRPSRPLLEAIQVKRLPIVAMTAKALSGDREKCLECGMDDYVTKPVQIETLIGIARKWAPECVDAQATSEDEGGSSLAIEAQGAGTAPFDTDTLDSLRDQDVALFEMILETFLEETPRQMSEMLDALGTKQDDKLRRLAHKLKGTTLTLGMQKLGELAGELEEREFTEAEKASALDRLDLELRKACAFMEEELRKIKAGV